MHNVISTESISKMRNCEVHKQMKEIVHAKIKNIKKNETDKTNAIVQLMITIHNRNVRRERCDRLSDTNLGKFESQSPV